MIPRVLLGGLAVALLAATPSSAALRTCQLSGSKQRALGPTYVTSLRVSHTSCTSGERLVRAYYNCRKAHGGIKGTCHSRVRGYHCTEKRGGIRTQFSAKVTCHSGTREVVHTYTQFT
jgi:hypothetical protein